MMKDAGLFVRFVVGEAIDPDQLEAELVGVVAPLDGTLVGGFGQPLSASASRDEH